MTSNRLMAGSMRTFLNRMHPLIDEQSINVLAYYNNLDPAMNDLPCIPQITPFVNSVSSYIED